MRLTTGSRLGHYEIASVLGVGGMGEVYRAHDSRLNRDVALKVLPAALASDGERLARFRREAQLLASLNHQNIAHVYGLEELEGQEEKTFALLMELVEGPTLADRIARGPIPLAEALVIARQIIDALDAAHEQGIVHRDLKPANIKVKDDGTTKVLDFGLAKTMDPTRAPESGPDLTNSPTITAMTGVGVILGTAAYMSPEQARGRPVDRRADIWAFGAVFYEMLTGRRAFSGDDVSVTLASVLKDDVKWDALPIDVPASVVRVLRRCLEREPKRRLSAIGDARLDLDEPSAPMTASVVSLPPRRSTRLAWSIAVASTLGALLAVGGLWRFARTARPPDTVRFSIPVVLTDLSPAIGLPALSPDGRSLAYVATLSGSGQRAIWMRRLDALDAVPLAGTEGAGFIFWTADSGSLVFNAGGKLKRALITGGSPQSLCDVPGFLGGASNERGQIVFSSNGRLFLFDLNTTDKPKLLAEPNPQNKELEYRWPAFLPDGVHVLYQILRDDASHEVFVRAIDGGGGPERVVQADTQATYSSGALIYQRGTTVFAQPFDLSVRRLYGEPTPIADGVRSARALFRGAFDVSSNGVFAYRGGTPDEAIGSLTWVDRMGQSLGTVGGPMPYNQVRLSPDEQSVAATVIDNIATSRVVTIDLSTGVTSELTDGGLYPNANDPLWSPDGRTLAFESIKNGKRDFYLQDLGRRSVQELYASNDEVKWLDDWTLDGRFVVFHQQSGRLFALPLASPRAPMPLLTARVNVDEAHVSHDGRWIAFGNNDSGRWETWIASFPGMDHRKQISTGRGGGTPFWRGDDREIFYLDPEGKVMSVGLAPDAVSGELTAQTPRELFQLALTGVAAMTSDQYAVARDGKRFLYIRRTDGPTSTSPIVVTLNGVRPLN